MELKKIAGWFFRSPVGILGVIGAIAAGGLGFGAGFGVFPTFALSFATLAIFWGLALSTRTGLKSLLSRKDQDEADRASALLAGAREARQRIASMRLTDPALVRARDRLALESGKFLEVSASRLKEKPDDTRPLFDPEAIQAILDARELLDSLVRELDESASERRFGASDAHAVENPVERTIAAIDAKCSTLIQGRDRLSAIQDSTIRLAIEEELK